LFGQHRPKPHLVRGLLRGIALGLIVFPSLVLVVAEACCSARAQDDGQVQIEVWRNKNGESESGTFIDAENREAVSEHNEALAGGQVVKFDNMTFEKSTDRVPATVGTLFGFRYQIVGASLGKPILLTFITRFPQPGLHPPEKGDRPPIPFNKFQGLRTIGNIFHRVYGFDAPWELVPGVWILEIWSGDESKKLIEQSFTIYSDK
jgi:Domain of unknown function (DUF3859)